MAKLPLTNSDRMATVDDEDYGWASQHAWRHDEDGHVVRDIVDACGNPATVYLCNEVLSRRLGKPLQDFGPPRGVRRVESRPTRNAYGLFETELTADVAEYLVARVGEEVPADEDYERLLPAYAEAVEKGLRPTLHPEMRSVLLAHLRASQDGPRYGGPARHDARRATPARRRPAPERSRRRRRRGPPVTPPEDRWDRQYWWRVVGGYYVRDGHDRWGNPKLIYHSIEDATRQLGIPVWTFPDPKPFPPGREWLFHTTVGTFETFTTAVTASALVSRLFGEAGPIPCDRDLARLLSVFGEGVLRGLRDDFPARLKPVLLDALCSGGRPLQTFEPADDVEDSLHMSVGRTNLITFKAARA
jgi:hypothetical protein